MENRANSIAAWFRYFPYAPALDIEKKGLPP